MQPITNKLTKLLNIKSPIVAAPMYGASTPALAAAVTAAGGFGLIGAGPDTSEKLRGDLQKIRTELGVPAGEPVPAGVGFAGWVLDITEASGDPRIRAVLDEMPTAIWFGYGIDLWKYISQVRAYDAGRAHKTVIFVIVNSVSDALRAANEWKADVLVVQGIEAGGHGQGKAPPLFELLQAVLTAVPDGPVIIATGGVSTGAQVASLLTMGAAGVALGTRFLYTDECSYTDVMKSVLVGAGLNATVRTHLFDEVNRTVGWPPGTDSRGIANDIVTDFEQGLSLEERLKRFDDGQAKGEKERLVIWAGTGVGLVNEIGGASDVMCALHDEMIASLKAVSQIMACL